MQAARHLIRNHARLALLLAVIALAIKFVVPAGYMPSAQGHGFAVTICTGMGLKTVSLAGDNRAPTQHDSSDRDMQPCAFAGLGLLATGSIDPPSLVAALRHAALVALFFLPLAFPQSRAFLRPPLRGPPARA